MHNLQQVLVLVAVSGPSLLRNAGALTAGDQTGGEVLQMQEQSSRLLGGWLILDGGTTNHHQNQSISGPD